MKTILVTGGAGFIGSNFIKYMKSKYDYRIVNLDKLTYAGNLENLDGVVEGPDYRFVHGDICDEELVSRIFKEERITSIINFAAESHVDRSIHSAKAFLMTNVIGCQVLLDAGKRAWIDKAYEGYEDDIEEAKFIQISTDEVYGSISEGFADEKHSLEPNSPYSASKASADLLVRSYGATHGLSYNITRCSNNYGPNQYPEKLIPLMIEKVTMGEKLPIYGNGQQIRDWIHVEDHCRAIDLVMHKGKRNEIYNVGANREYRNIDLVKQIIGILKADESLITYVKDRAGHDYRYGLDASKIRENLGWKPVMDFDKSFEDLVLGERKSPGKE